MYLKCNKCGKKHKLGVLVCDLCGSEYFEYVSVQNDENNLNQRLEDIKHTMSLLKDELNELIKTYIDPWTKQ